MSQSGWLPGFQFQRADVPPFNAPLIEPLAVLPFAARLRLIARQLYRYRHLYELDPKLAQLASEPIAEAIPEPAFAGVVAPTAPVSDDPASQGKVGRNQPCPCGSGKKYKQCHGALR